MQIDKKLTNEMQNLDINNSYLELIQEWERVVDLTLKYQKNKIIDKIDQSQKFMDQAKHLANQEEVSGGLYLIANKMINIINSSGTDIDGDTTKYLLNTALKVCNLATELQISNKKFKEIESIAESGINICNVFNSSTAQHQQNYISNLDRSDSRTRDVDLATEVIEFAKGEIISKEKKPSSGQFTKLLKDNRTNFIPSK